jgi:hypothetical protein
LAFDVASARRKGAPADQLHITPWGSNNFAIRKGAGVRVVTRSTKGVRERQFFSSTNTLLGTERSYRKGVLQVRTFAMPNTGMTKAFTSKLTGVRVKGGKRYFSYSGPLDKAFSSIWGKLNVRLRPPPRLPPPPLPKAIKGSVLSPNDPFGRINATTLK